MKKYYCDKCGKELKDHEGHFLWFQKSYNLMFWKWDLFSKTKFMYDDEELCEDCYFLLITIFEEQLKKKE